MHALTWLLVLLLGSHAPLGTRASACEAALAALEGRWQGDGTRLGHPERASLQLTRVLDAHFARLLFESTMATPKGAVTFEGHAYYEPTNDGARATWFDSTGMTRPIQAVCEPRAMVATWGTPQTEVGETRYALEAVDRLVVVDRVQQKDGNWRAFGRATLRRQP